MFGSVLALVVIVLWVRFALGCMKLDIPYDLLEVSPNRIVLTRVLSAGFLVVVLAAQASPLLALRSPPSQDLLLLPLAVLFCAPGLVAIHRLRAHLETRGGQAKPVMAWLDRGVLAGWSAVCFGVLWWALTLPLLPSVV
jgi:amino acid permease